VRACHSPPSYYVVVGCPGSVEIALISQRATRTSPEHDRGASRQMPDLVRPDVLLCAPMAEVPVHQTRSRGPPTTHKTRSYFVNASTISNSVGDLPTIPFHPFAAIVVSHGSKYVCVLAKSPLELRM